MLEAAFWAFVGGSALLIGTVCALTIGAKPKTIGLVMAFGSGTLISSVSFELTSDAFDRGGADALAAGLALGALAFFVGDWLIDRRGGDNRKRLSGQLSDGSSMAIVLGALLDGIPESLAIGVTLLEGSGVGIPFVAAVFISNFPEALAATSGMKADGRSTRFIAALWIAVVAASSIAAFVGFGLFDGASENLTAGIQAFAAGAILTMLADTMMPEAFEHGGKAAGLVTVLGFALAFLLSTLP